MKISCFADEISPLLSDQLRVMQELGIKWMDLRSCWNTGVLQLSGLQIEDICNLTMERGIGISCISTPIGKESIESPEENATSQLKRAMEIAHKCNSRFIRIFSYYPGDTPRPQAQELARVRLANLARMAEAEQLVLVVESASVTTCGTGAELAGLMKYVNSPSLQAVFDPAAFVPTGEHPFDDSLPQVLPWLQYVHIKDAKFGHKERLIAGTGDAQVAQILKALAEREGLYISLEPHLSFAGPAGGFSGEMPFRSAHRALVDILNKENISYQ